MPDPKPHLEKREKKRKEKLSVQDDTKRIVRDDDGMVIVLREYTQKKR